MKIKLLLFFGLFTSILFSCHKKIIPVKTEPEVTENPANSSNALPLAMIVIDGHGNVLTPKDKLPVDAGINPDYSKIARSFTPRELANLKIRYKTVPPKVIYVPEIYAKKTARGTYAVYKKKFWYWKQEDGLFYLDKTYYE